MCILLGRINLRGFYGLKINPKAKVITNSTYVCKTAEMIPEWVDLIPSVKTQSVSGLVCRIDNINIKSQRRPIDPSKATCLSVILWLVCLLTYEFSNGSSFRDRSDGRTCHAVSPLSSTVMQVSISPITIPPRTSGDLHQTFAPDLGLLHPSFCPGGGGGLLGQLQRGRHVPINDVCHF